MATTPLDENNEIIPPKEEEKNLLSKALHEAKNILTGQEDENVVVDEVITAKSELEKALAEDKTILKEPEKVDPGSIREKMEELTQKADALEEKLDTFEEEAGKNKEIEKAASIDVEALREVSQEVKEVAKETVEDLVKPADSGEL